MKRVQAIDAQTLVPTVLATFELVDGSVVADYHDPDYQLEVEGFGIYSMATGEVRPSDGRRFFDALDVAYSRSSFIYVDEG